MSSFQTGVIKSIVLKDNDINEVYSITVFLAQSSGILRTAYPLDTSIKRVPLIGEIVLVFSSIGLEASYGGRGTRLYYMNPVSLQLNPNNNVLPPTIAPLVSKTKNNSYNDTATGNANVANKDDSEHNLGDGFVENDKVGSLQPFIGDVLIEGRFGHSLRFGYTPQEPDTTIKPNWPSSTPRDPITILSNGRKNDGQFNKFVIEDADDDLSSIWLTTSQKVTVDTSLKLASGVDPQNSFESPSVIIASDRILLNSKSDYIILSGGNTQNQGGVSVSTPNWKIDMDEFFTQVLNLIDEVDKLNKNVEKAHTEYGKIADALTKIQLITPPGIYGGPTTGPPTNAGDFISAKINSELNTQALEPIKTNVGNIQTKIKQMKQQQ
tara:strand:- start:169 stop:1308 length:1140 start_codon:yes stop_codon:yes gene_type:complete